MQARSKYLKPYICILSVAYTLFFGLTYALGSDGWLLHVDSGEAGIHELIYIFRKWKVRQQRTKTLSHRQAPTFASLHIRAVDFPCSVQLCSLLNHTERCMINHIKAEQSHVTPEGQPVWVLTTETRYD